MGAVTSLIKTRQDYETNMGELRELFEADPAFGTPENDRLELLALLVEEYETKNTSLGPPDPIEAIVFMMEQKDLRQADLVPILGSRSRVSEMISRKRPLSLAQIRNLSTYLDIPIEVLMQDSEGIAA